MRDGIVTIQRDRKASNKVVFGKLTCDWMKSHPDIYTIEPLKCIPAGLYKLVGHQGRLKNVWLLKDVPGYESILIHAGNFACDVSVNGLKHESDSEGCILVGFGIEEVIPMITRSKPAIDYLRTMWGIKKDGEAMNIDIEIKD
jgi:hypothetical protein